MTLVLRKLLASSTFAIAGALETLGRRLRARLQQAKEAQELEEELNEDFEALDEIAEEWGEEDTAPEPLSTSERNALAREIEDLESFRALAVSITHNAKGAALLTALQTAFAKAEELGASASLLAAPMRTAWCCSAAPTTMQSLARSTSIGSHAIKAPIA
jgi:adenine-specific DNA-methyltransferase